MREKGELEEIMPELPEDDEVFKILSNGGFSSIAFVKSVADKTRIDEMLATTLRVGRKHLEVIDVLYKNGAIGKVKFIIGSLMKNDSERGVKYGYYDDLKKKCDENGWEISISNNHSKILLMDTKKGKFVLETSSNLNENPKMEQFSFEKSEELFNMYMNFFKGVKNNE
ncbi:MAG: hypothetical protein RSD63_08735 [Eubacterium sp.]